MAIMNDVLDEANVDRAGPLDRFKQSVLRRSAEGHRFLLDFGSSSGRFLHQNRNQFTNCAGVEISERCRQFSREKLGLTVYEHLADVPEKDIDTVTFWHSLEHVPPDEMVHIMESLRNLPAQELRVIVSVPDCTSLQYRLLGSDFAYYDALTHMNQFSVLSLEKLMAKHGFSRIRGFYSLPYAFFGYLQGMMNKVNFKHNYLYYRKKRGVTLRRKGVQMLCDAYNWVLVLGLTPVALVLTLVDFLVGSDGGVITACYART